MESLTSAQRKMLNYLTEEARAGRPMPTLREIARHFHFKSHRSAACHLEALKRKGCLSSERGKARSLCIANIAAGSIPVFGDVSAGFAQDRVQQTEEFVPIDPKLFGAQSANTFALRVKGDSMVDAHICDGDVAFFERGVQPRSGQIVAALIDQESTLKIFMVKHGKPFLRAANQKYPDLIPADELTVQGVFRGLLRTIIR